MQRKQPIIRNRKNTKEEASLHRATLTSEATEQNTKVSVSNKRNEREDNSYKTEDNNRINNIENKDIKELKDG